MSSFDHSSSVGEPFRFFSLKHIFGMLYGRRAVSSSAEQTPPFCLRYLFVVVCVRPFDRVCSSGGKAFRSICFRHMFKIWLCPAGLFHPVVGRCDFFERSSAHRSFSFFCFFVFFVSIFLSQPDAPRASQQVSKQNPCCSFDA